MYVSSSKISAPLASPSPKATPERPDPAAAIQQDTFSPASSDEYSWKRTGQVALKAAAFAAPAALGAASGNFNWGLAGLMGSMGVSTALMIDSRNDDLTTMALAVGCIALTGTFSALGGYGGFTGAAVAIGGAAGLTAWAHRSTASDQ